MTIFVISMIASYKGRNSATWNIEHKLYSFSSAEVVRDVILCIFGNNQIYYPKPILFIGHLGVIVQLLCHLPLIFYIGKEHVLQSVDEYQNVSLSQMVDRIRDNISGDPRFFLAQKKYFVRTKSFNQEEIQQIVPVAMANSQAIQPAMANSFEKYFKGVADHDRYLTEARPKPDSAEASERHNDLHNFVYNNNTNSQESSSHHQNNRSKSLRGGVFQNHLVPPEQREALLKQTMHSGSPSPLAEYTPSSGNPAPEDGVILAPNDITLSEEDRAYAK